jgi:hypothetical protein
VFLSAHARLHHDPSWWWWWWSTPRLPLQAAQRVSLNFFFGWCSLDFGPIPTAHVWVHIHIQGPAGHLQLDWRVVPREAHGRCRKGTVTVGGGEPYKGDRRLSAAPSVCLPVCLSCLSSSLVNPSRDQLAASRGQRKSSTQKLPSVVLSHVGSVFGSVISIHPAGM